MFVPFTPQSALLTAPLQGSLTYRKCFDEDAFTVTPRTESCRLVQGSMQETVSITSELRTERFTSVGCAGCARYSTVEC